MSRDELIRKAIEEKIAPEYLEVINQSYLHQGHAGDDGSGESHYKLIVVSKVFLEYGRIDRHRLVYNAIGNDLMNKIHALEVDCRTE